MNFKEMKVVLSYFIAGTQLLPGDYIYREKTNKGKLLPEKHRLFIKRPVIYSECKQIVTLGTPFILHAISLDGKPPYRQDSFHNKIWKRMSKIERLKYNIEKYVYDMGGTLDSYEMIYKKKL